MVSLLGNLDNTASDPLPKKTSRKRKPSPMEDLSDQEIPSTGDVFTSPIKPRVDDESTMPATEQLANLEVYSNSEDEIT